MDEFTINNGDRVKSRIQGFKGVVTARADHLHGCNRYFIEPPVDKDGKISDGCWFDEDDLEVTKAKVIPRANNQRGGFPSTIK